MTANALLNSEERRVIAKAIENAERGTSGDIVVAVAARSGRYERAEDIFGLLTALLLLAVVWNLYPEAPKGKWSDAPSSGLLLGSILILMVGFIAGAALAAFVPLLRLPFIPRGEMRSEVEKRAAQIFFSHHLRAAGGNGVLIYISLFERLVHILADTAAAERITLLDWEPVHSAVTEAMRTKRPISGIEKAIQRSGELLGRHFPASPTDKRKEHERLIFLE